LLNFQFFFDKKKVEKRIEIFCNIINVFAVNFDQFNVSMLNKSINLKKKGIVKRWCRYMNIVDFMSKTDLYRLTFIVLAIIPSEIKN